MEHTSIGMFILTGSRKKPSLITIDRFMITL